MDRHAHFVGTPLEWFAMWRGQPLGLSDLDLVHTPQPGNHAKQIRRALDRCPHEWSDTEDT